MDTSMTFLDGNCNLFMDPTTSSLTYDANLFEFIQIDDFISTTLCNQFSLDSTSSSSQVLDVPETCNPEYFVDSSIDFSEFLNDGWVERLLTSASNPETLIAPDAPVQLTTPPGSLPSTPKRAPKALRWNTATSPLTPPSSDRPVRTRRYDAYNDICSLSQLSLKAPDPVESTVDPTSIFLPAPAAAYTKETLGVQPDVNTHYYPSPSTTAYHSPSASSSSSPANSCISISAPSSPSNYTPSPSAQRSARSTGAKRRKTTTRKRSRPLVIVADADLDIPPLLTENREKPYGCPHCGVACGLKHDWNRHVRLHSSKIFFACFGCDRGFKRSDARNRHWDSRRKCEYISVSLMREMFYRGELNERELKILRNRARKAKCMRESERTGIDWKDLKKQTKCETEGPGF